jgi:alcohol dehydrogenase (cytochrome c)
MKLHWLAGFALALAAQAQVQNFKPVTEEMLKNPSPNDWLMFSRTYDAQRFSPLNQINRGNVAKLTEVWSHDMGSTGNTESIPIVHDGVLYVAAPGATVQALDGATGKFAVDLYAAGKRRLIPDQEPCDLSGRDSLHRP